MKDDVFICNRSSHLTWEYAHMPFHVLPEFHAGIYTGLAITTMWTTEGPCMYPF